MYAGKEHGKAAGNKVSRLVESGTKQRSRAASNSRILQRRYSERQDANANTMWQCRQTLGVANTTLPNNVAWSGNAIARSSLNGHSEIKAVMLNLGMLQANNIHVHTERQPCGDCREDLMSLAQFGNQGGGINVTAHYLIPYTGNSVVDVANLKNTYGI